MNMIFLTLKRKTLLNYHLLSFSINEIVEQKNRSLISTYTYMLPTIGFWLWIVQVRHFPLFHARRMMTWLLEDSVVLQLVTCAYTFLLNRYCANVYSTKHGHN